MPFDSSCWIVWNKENGATDFADCELAWTSLNTAVRKFDFKWQGMLQQDMANKEIRIHPTQKPVALYKWLLEKYSKPNFKILDTHLGSGSIAVGFNDMIQYWISQGLDVEGAELIACELDKDYYDASI